MLFVAGSVQIVQQDTSTGFGDFIMGEQVIRSVQYVDEYVPVVMEETVCI
jgi:hypothetical protein